MGVLGWTETTLLKYTKTNHFMYTGQSVYRLQHALWLDVKETACELPPA